MWNFIIFKDEFQSIFRHKIEVADEYVVYLYSSDPLSSPIPSYVQFVNGTHKIDSATTTTDGMFNGIYCIFI